MLGATRAKFAAIGKDLRILYVNEACSKVWERRPEDVIGMHVKEILGTKNFENSLDKFTEAITGKTVDFEAEFTVGLRTFVLAIRLVPFYGTEQGSANRGEAQGVYIFSQYVTGKRVSQQALSLILASAPGKICLVNRDYEITYANRRSTRTTVPMMN